MTTGSQKQLPWALSDQAMLAASAALVMVTAFVDFTTKFINLPILYFIPLIMCSSVIRRRALLWFTAILVALTYGMFLWENRAAIAVDPGYVLTYRMINRTLVALGLCFTARMIGKISPSDSAERRSSLLYDRSPDASFEEATQALSSLFIVLLCITLIVFIFATDLFSPRQFNLPILYVVPLILVRWSGSRLAIWILLPIVLIGTWVAFWIGPSSTIPANYAPPNIIHVLMTNRGLATAVQVCVAAMMHLRMTSRPKSERMADFGHFSIAF